MIGDVDAAAAKIRHCLQTVVDEFGPNVTETPDIWDDGFSALDALVAEVEQLRAREQRLQEALRFYADPVSYENATPRHVRPVIKDRGDVARAALAATDPPPPQIPDPEGFRQRPMAADPLPKEEAP